MKRATALAAIALAAAAVLAGCGNKATNPLPPGSNAGKITLAPASRTVFVHGTVDLSAVVENLGDTRLRWTLERLSPTPDTASLGTVVATGAGTATYTAPDQVRTNFDSYRILVVATSVADSTIWGSATITVPKILIAVIPGHLSSVLPGSLVPYVVQVQYTPNTDFSLFVQGFPGGDPSVGTWAGTGGANAVYRAPRTSASTTIFDLLALSADDPGRFSTATIGVRAGFPLPTARPDLSQYAPAWVPTGEITVAFVQGGPPWEVAVWDSAASQERTLATLSWSGSSYDGRVAWSRDGTKLAFSEEVGGRRAIGIVSADGSGRATLAPDPGTDYWEAAFLPPARAGDPESLFVSQTGAAGAEIRAYPLSAGAGESGRLVFAAGAGRTVRWPDAMPGSTLRPAVAFERSDGFSSEILHLADDGSGAATLDASGSGRRTQVRWANQLVGGTWITYLWSETQNAYRVRRGGFPAPQRLYTDFFPELGTDLSFAVSFDGHVVSRLEPSGKARLWVVQFPPYDVVPVSQAEELELASIGAYRALSPFRWQRWLVTP